MTIATKLLALLKRELLEHNSLWRIPLVLLLVNVLLRLALLFGNLSFDANLTDINEIDQQLDLLADSTVNKGVVVWAVTMNYLSTVVMFIVALLYALSSLFNERQDNSVLFWRSLPVSDRLTVIAKLLVAVVLVPIIVVLTHILAALILFDVHAFAYLNDHFIGSVSSLMRWVLWSLLPVSAWCLACSSVADKNPFLLALLIPILLVIVDKLFLNGAISQYLVINRLGVPQQLQILPLLGGLAFSAACVMFAVFKRSQRI